jgi:hypothetical protein
VALLDRIGALAGRRDLSGPAKAGGVNGSQPHNPNASPDEAKEYRSLKARSDLIEHASFAIGAVILGALYYLLFGLKLPFGLDLGSAWLNSISLGGVIGIGAIGMRTGIHRWINGFSGYPVEQYQTLSKKLKKKPDYWWE